MNEHNSDQAANLPSESFPFDAETVLPEGDSTADPAPTIDSTGPTLRPATGPTLRYFGEYELLAEIARGGMGVVYRAKQVKLNRLVALKMILAGQLAGEDDVKRFHTEAEAAANLDHPGIVPIYEVGEHEGQHYFSMAFIEGPSLSSALAKGPLPPQEAAQIVKAVTEAMAYAHERGVIHRDLKPANILLAKVNAKRSTAVFLSVEGMESGWYEPKVTDFGLAKKTEGDGQLTGTGQILGTPSYMPPEQAGGRTEEIGPLADVYSLGAILYCLLTGRPPFQSAGVMDTLIQVLEHDPVPPQLLNSKVPKSLDAICMKCLAKPIDLRYASAKDLGREFQRFLEGEPVEARSFSLLESLRSCLERSRDEDQIAGWGTVFLAFGLVIFLIHFSTFLLQQLGESSWVYFWAPRGLMFGVLSAIVYRALGHNVWPKTSTQRITWGIWVAYIFGYLLVAIVNSQFGGDPVQVYAYSAVLSGTSFLAMGSYLWGWHYLIGFFFLALAPVLALVPPVAPVVFGLVWSAILIFLGLRYSRLASPVSGKERETISH